VYKIFRIAIFESRFEFQVQKRIRRCCISLRGLV